MTAIELIREISEKGRRAIDASHLADMQGVGPVIVIKQEAAVDLISAVRAAEQFLQGTRPG